MRGNSVWRRWRRALGGVESGVATRADLETSLISADVGTSLAERLCSSLPRSSGSGSELRAALAASIADMLRPCERPIDFSEKVTIIFAGVNGSGKTTTIGKLAGQVGGGRTVIAACDTFRAAASDQLCRWADRTGARFVQAGEGISGHADPASIAWRAARVADEESRECLFIDTAGRLPNRTELMTELAKIQKVAQKAARGRTFHGLVVIDAGSGSNAVAQIEAFRTAMTVTGIVLTKLDGTARGGIALAIADHFGIPVHYVGLGEGANDLVAFDAAQFAQGLMRVE